LEVCRSDFLIVLIIARWREANAVPVEPVPAAVALQHWPLAVVRQLAQAVQLHRILQGQQTMYSQLQLWQLYRFFEVRLVSYPFACTIARRGERDKTYELKQTVEPFPTNVLCLHLLAMLSSTLGTARQLLWDSKVAGTI